MSGPAEESGGTAQPVGPSLDGAYRRVHRALEHIESLAQHEGGIARHMSPLRVLPDSETSELLPDGGRQFTSQVIELPNLPPADPNWSILVGEAVYNLRAALDYLVFALAHLDSGSPQKQTQFPICRKPEEFLGQARRRLAGVNETHVQAIEALQPYACEGPDSDWLARLADLSNPDKHRHLVVTIPANELHTELEARKEPDGFRITARVLPAVVIVFDDEGDAPVVARLQSLARRAQQTLDQFAPDFGVAKD